MKTKLVTVKQIAAQLAVHPSTIWRMVERGDLPPPIRIGLRCTRWSADAVEDFVNRHQANIEQ
jgi:excisionase family DNA binding protein